MFLPKNAYADSPGQGAAMLQAEQKRTDKIGTLTSTLSSTSAVPFASHVPAVRERKRTAAAEEAYGRQPSYTVDSCTGMCR